MVEVIAQLLSASKVIILYTEYNQQRIFMRKAVLGAYSLLIAGTLTLGIFSPSSLAVPPASAPESQTETIPSQSFKVSENVEPVKLERDSYSATTPEELEVIKENKAAEEKAAAEAKAAEEKAKNAAAKPQVASAGTPTYSGGGSPAEWMAAAGIAESDWGYVDYIVSKESGWNPNAVNSSSGASGLVQALPCGKVPGSCFNPVDNLKWADGYAKGRYGSWAGAYNFWTSNHWW